MKVFGAKRNFLSPQNLAQRGSSRPLLLAIVCFALGAALTAFWFYRQSGVANARQLSEQTRVALAGLTAPVNVSYYAVLPTNSADAKLAAFASRVDQLLAAMQEAGNGKIQVTRIQSASETNLTAAASQGIQAFNLVQDDACLLGLVISSGANKQTLSRLDPEWEPALQYDLIRTILAVASASTPAVPSAVAKPSPEIIASINHLIPDVATVTSEQADQILRAEYLKQCEQLSTDAQTKIQAAQQQVVQAQNSGSPAALEAAKKDLLQTQVAQANKLKDLAAQLEIQLAVFQKMKAEANKNAK
jgi:hypothetical protein